MVKHPKFVRPNLRKVKRVKDKWRKPHGIDSKQRQKLKWAGAVVNKGYRGSVVSRGLHPLGKAEVLVRNFGELEKNKAEWQNSVLIKNDAANEIAQLKKQVGPEIHIHGSSGLIQTLLKNDLADEIRLWIFPVVLGSGKRFFGTGAQSGAWKLVESKTSGTGVLIAFYRRAGEIQRGSAALETPTEAERARRKKVNTEN